MQELKFPLVQLPKKFKELISFWIRHLKRLRFPLVQLPKKFKDDGMIPRPTSEEIVSISSTSEEVQRCRGDALHSPGVLSGFH